MISNRKQIQKCNCWFKAQLISIHQMKKKNMYPKLKNGNENENRYQN